MGDFIAELVALILAVVTLIIQLIFIKSGQRDFRRFLFRRIAWAQYTPPTNFDINEAVQWVLAAHVKRDDRKTIEIGDIILPVKFMLLMNEHKKDIKKIGPEILNISQSKIKSDLVKKVYKAVYDNKLVEPADKSLIESESDNESLLRAKFIIKGK